MWHKTSAQILNYLSFKALVLVSARVLIRPLDRYHLKDVIVGKIYFLLVRIKIKHMEIDIIKRETTGTGPSVYHENDTIAKYEIMDGAPARGTRLVLVVSVTKHLPTQELLDIVQPDTMYSIFQESPSPSGYFWLVTIWLPPCETSTRSSPCATTWTWFWSTRRRGATSNSR